MNKFFCIILLTIIIMLFYSKKKRNISKKGGNIKKMKFPIIIFIGCLLLTLLWFLYSKDIFNITSILDSKESKSSNIFINQNEDEEIISFNDGTKRNIWGEIRT